ncbi:MAG: hypothetical protein QXJ17_07415 [Nitrososphaeria archaeon]
MIVPTKIKDGNINIPKEILERYKIENNTFLILIPIEQGILVRPIFKKEGNAKKTIEIDQALENEINAIVTELSDTLELKKEQTEERKPKEQEKV